MSGTIREAQQSEFDRWRAYVAAQAGTDSTHADALEAQLRGQVDALEATGLDAEEAFLVALKRVARDDAATREFAREYAAGLWASGTTTVGVETAPDAGGGRDFLVMLALACAAGAAIKLPTLWGLDFEADGARFYLMNMSFFALPFLAALFAWSTRTPRRVLVPAAGVFVAGAILVNAFPFVRDGSTQILSAIHLPVLLWLTVGVVGAGAAWRSVSARMEFVRFTGEWAITYGLIAAGGGVLTAITIGVFSAIGLDAELLMTEWVVPCGAMGAVIVASWLVSSRRNLIGGVAPMLARVFTPLFSVMLVALLVGVVGTKGVIHVEREVLLMFDILLALVLALLLYAISARDPKAEPGLFDRIQLVLVSCALVVDVFALANIAVRLTEYGFSANRVAVLGLNVILLVNLAWSAWLQVGFLRGRRGFEEIERWQMRYLLVYAVWAAIVVAVFPPLFAFA